MHQKILSVTRSRSQILQECMRVSFKFNNLICVFPQSVWNQVMIHDDAHWRVSLSWNPPLLDLVDEEEVVDLPTDA